jgi:hypothetical protein
MDSCRRSWIRSTLPQGRPSAHTRPIAGGGMTLGVDGGGSTLGAGVGGGAAFSAAVVRSGRPATTVTSRSNVTNSPCSKRSRCVPALTLLKTTVPDASVEPSRSIGPWLSPDIPQRLPIHTRHEHRHRRPSRGGTRLLGRCRLARRRLDGRRLGRRRLCRTGKGD